MSNSYTDKLLRVNLSEGTVKTEKINRDWQKEFIGGRGLATKYLISETDSKTDPLGKENKLIFVTGPLTGTSAPTGARYMVVTKSPLTGTIACSNSGGYFGSELKFAGYDMIIFEGASDKPVYLSIYNDDVVIKDAAAIWGKGVWETEDILKSVEGDSDSRVAAIGPAGENKVLFSCIVNEKHRAAGRSGVGAVMGSKKLKAIVVRGTKGIGVSNPERFFEDINKSKEILREAPVTGQALPAYGTAVLVNVMNEYGGLPSYNFRSSQFANAEKISGETIADTRLVANKACFACTIACGRVTKLPDDASEKYIVSTSSRNWKDAGGGPEYENIWAMAPLCGIDDIDALIKANWLCNDLGMDPISYGATLACAMELYENGAIDEKTAGMNLNFGNAEALVKMVYDTGHRSGFGDYLAEGSYRLSKRFSHPEFFMGVKKQEFPAYDPRAVQGIGLAYATNNRGADHLRAYTIASEIMGIPEKTDPAETEGKAALTKLFQDATGVVDSSGLCIFCTFAIGLPEIVPMINSAAGSDYSVDDALKIGERIWNMEHLYNLSAGILGAEDTLPKRILEGKIAEGPTKGMVNKLDKMLPEYYQLRGWDDNAVPSKEKIEELGLG